ncbi:MAG: ATP-dependent endonuclease [Pseudohongiella sp.]|nr:MAG: ATP-dependent endonuclease [Pseudohongiella sp.]
MRLSKLRIKNFRSIADSSAINITSLQAFVGENNAGKSNILKAISCFLTSGAGGMKLTDFKDITQACTIECEFEGLNDGEKRNLRPYLLGDKVILEKSLWHEVDERTQKSSIKAEYHGYLAEPANELLSISKIETNHGPRPKWAELAAQAGVSEYMQDENGRINKTSYRKGLEQYLYENEVEYDEPELGNTQALGIPQNLLASLPQFYLLPAITDYSDEVDRRSTSTVFRKLMHDLAERVMKADPRYQELEESLERIRTLLNPMQGGAQERLQSLTTVENDLTDLIKKLMPSVNSINLDVEVDATTDIFSKGVTIRIDDGVLTDVLDKGHGMQRSMVFSLLQMLIYSIRDQEEDDSIQPIILAIEEPELYIHPHSQRLIFRVLKEFAGLANEGEIVGSDQVIYTTHSPTFVEVWNYDRIGIIRKPDLATGSIVKQAEPGILGDPEERKAFKVLTCFGLKHNEVFFCASAIVVEGIEDEVGIIAASRKLDRVDDLLDEIGVSVLVTGGKGDIPKFQKILNAFEIDYGVLLEMDGEDAEQNQNAPVIENIGNGRLAQIPNRVEDLIGLGRHFKDQREAKTFFSDANNINEEFLAITTDLLPPPP